MFWKVKNNYETIAICKNGDKEVSMEADVENRSKKERIKRLLTPREKQDIN